MTRTIRNKIKEIINKAESLELTIVGGVQDVSGNLVAFCNDEYKISKSEEMTNIYLMMKNKGDLNKFLLDKSKCNKQADDESSTVTLTNPQVLNTQH